MKKRNRLRAATSTMLAVATLGSIGTVAALADSESAPGPRAREVTALPATSASPRLVERQRGIVMEGSGELSGTPFAVTVYENSLYGNTVQVVLGDPEDDRIGYVTQQGPFVVDDRLVAEVRIEGDVVALHGTVAPTGRSERSTEPAQDAGEQIVTRGTHTQLATDVTLSFGGEQTSVAFAPAFAYDLEVQRVDLYGG